MLGNTLNIMTLGGLALAVGILVDDATVAIENTYRLMEEGADFPTSVVEGAAGIAKPALISTLSICCAFVSVLFLTDAARYIFTPQALAVVFAMLASYGLSRTIVPILIDVLVKSEFARAACTPRRRVQAASPASSAACTPVRARVRPLPRRLQALLHASLGAPLGHAVRRLPAPRWSWAACCSSSSARTTSRKSRPAS